MADVAVLLSGGLDSAVLVAHAARAGEVQPIYVSAGLAWEREERALVERLLQSPPYASGVLPAGSVRRRHDIYPATHQARSRRAARLRHAGRGRLPAGTERAGAVEGRNPLRCCAASRIAIGPLAGNPFPDATPEFLASMSQTLSLGLANHLTIEAPFSGMHKQEVIALGASLGVRFELTLSCMKPSVGRHCGPCSSARAPRRVQPRRCQDPTEYLAAAPRGHSRRWLGIVLTVMVPLSVRRRRRLPPRRAGASSRPSCRRRRPGPPPNPAPGTGRRQCRVEAGVEIRRQLDPQPAVAGADLPVGRHRAPSRPDLDRSVARLQRQRLAACPSPRAAVAALQIERPGDVLEAQRAVAGGDAMSPSHRRPSRPVAGVQLDLAFDALDADRPVAAACDEVALPGHGGDDASGGEP
jgi:7-cyano-7-deazaguanine synthase